MVAIIAATLVAIIYIANVRRIFVLTKHSSYFFLRKNEFLYQDMLETVNQRVIKFYSEYLNLGKTEFAKSIGMSKQVVSGLDTATTYPGYRFFEGIAKKYPEINMNWLIAGQGEMLLSGGDSSDSNSIANSVMPPHSQISQNNGKSGTININQHNEQIVRLLEQQLAAQSITIAAQGTTIEALSNEIARLKEQLNLGK